MFKRNRWLWALLLSAVYPCAQAQQPQTVYTHVAEWAVPRAQWDEFASSMQKSSVPILEKAIANGTILEFALTATVVHTEEGSTHTMWWASTTFSGTQRVLAELLRATPSTPGLSGKHRDRLLRSVIYNSKPAKLTSGFAYLSITSVPPGKGAQWRQYFDKYTKPVYDKLFADGAILGYGVDVEFIHTDAPGPRFGWYLAATGEAMDKVNEAFDAAQQAGSPQERQAAAAALNEVSAVAGHRDALDRILVYVHK